MGTGILKRLLDSLETAAAGVPDYRQDSNARKYEVSDAVKSAFAVFYFQQPSLLQFQHALETRHGRSNLQTLFDVLQIPSSIHIKNLLDDIEPASLSSVFDEALEAARESGALESYRVLEGTIPAALDGTWYFTSNEIHCAHCLRMHTKKKGGAEQTLYYHDMVAAAIVKPGKPVVVLPLIPEFIRNEDGSEKQDCERNAAKRWVNTHKERYSDLKLTILGDDLYSCHSLCADILDAGMSFLLTCKDDSHPWIAEQWKHSIPETLEAREWNGRSHLVYRYKWVNGIENRADGQTLSVNYLDFEIYNEQSGRVTTKGAWITNHTITKENVRNMAECARARWKIENEHNNVLKHHGYNLKHNFGHGKNHASEVFCLLNVLAFLFHGVQQLSDDEYQKARAAFGRRVDFFWAVRYETDRHLHENWHNLFLTLADCAPDG